MSYIEDITNLQQQMNNYMERLNAGRLSNKDSSLIIQVAGSYYEAFEKYQNQEQLTADHRETISNILNEISKFQDSIIKGDDQEIRAAYEAFSQIADTVILEVQRQEQLMKVFQTDLQEMELRETKIKTLQGIVDLDLKIYGEITQATLEVLDVQQCVLTEGHRVEEKETSPVSVMSAAESKSAETPMQQPERRAEQSYRANVYMKNSGTGKQKPKVIYGNSPEDILATLQGWNMGRTDAMQFQSCYISKLNVGTNTYENFAKYDVATGTDVTPIYLNIPHMERNAFIKLVGQLKKDGASYNPVKKQFFVTKQCDLNKFSQYLPIVGTQAETNENHSRNQLSYEVEAGQEYYDNRVKVTVEGMEPFNVFGDDYDVHFPSLSAEGTKEIIEKFVLPELEVSRPPKKIVKEVEYNGQKYDPLQYNVLELAIKQNFTQEQMQLLERPELSADRLNEIRFAIRDGLSLDQITQFATPSHEQWQMDLCRIGMQHGFAYEELKELINPDNYTNEQWGERRNQLAKMIRAREKVHNAPVKSYPPPTEGQKPKAEKGSIVMQLNQNKAKLEAGNKAAEAAERKDPIKGVER